MGAFGLMLGSLLRREEQHEQEEAECAWWRLNEADSRVLCLHVGVGDPEAGAQEEEEREREEAERRVREEAERVARLEEAAARQRAKEAEVREHLPAP